MARTVALHICLIQLPKTAAIGIKHRHKIISQYNKRSWTRAILKFGNRQQCCLLAQTFNISAGESFQSSRELFEIHIWSQRHALATQLHDRRAISSIRFCQLEYVVKASASQKRRVNPLWTIAGREQNHAFDVAQIINLTQQLAQNPLINVGPKLIGTKLRRYRVNRIEK